MTRDELKQKLEAVRDKLAEKYADRINNTLESSDARVRSFKEGWDAAMTIAKEREAKLVQPLVEALEKVIFALQCNIIKHNGKVPTMSDEQVFEASIEIRDQAKEALADHKRMMEEEE